MVINQPTTASISIESCDLPALRTWSALWSGGANRASVAWRSLENCWKFPRAPKTSIIIGEKR